jgi:hypothetical protein
MAQQQGQQQQAARSRGQSPCHMKRRSVELPPTSKCRRSQVGAAAHTASIAAAVCPRWLLRFAVWLVLTARSAGLNPSCVRGSVAPTHELSLRSQHVSLGVRPPDSMCWTHHVVSFSSTTLAGWALTQQQQQPSCPRPWPAIPPTDEPQQRICWQRCMWPCA